MSHIKLQRNLPGIVALFATNPATSAPMNALAEQLLRNQDNTLSREDRETIASYVSLRNGCHFCFNSHAAVVRSYYKKMGGKKIEDGVQVISDLDGRVEESAVLSEKMKALLNIAGLVQVSGKDVSDDAVERARDLGATDKEIHDTVLIAAAFCMFNRYVDGLDAPSDLDDDTYNALGDMLTENGYVNSKPVPSN